MKKFKRTLTLFLFSLIISFSFIALGLPKTVSAIPYQKLNKLDNLQIINDFQGVADYIHKYHRLPDNYITKAEAKANGWRAGQDLWKTNPGKSIGGDIFTNREKVLPVKKGRIWYECDINYNGGHRGADRIVFSNDGLIYGTSDHYKTFKLFY